MTELPFLVAGGGIAGLAAALGLSGIGRTARLFEQAVSFEEVGAGLQMSPNAVHALMALGAWEAVEPACVIPTEIHVRDGRSGSLMQRIRLGKPFEERFGAPYRVCHRADLLSGLLSAAQTRPQIELNTGMRVSSAGTFGNQTELVFDDGTKIDGQAIIAADGINSALRPAVCGDVKTAARGHVIFRSLIPFNAVPPDIEADCVTLWLYPGGHVVHYPVSNWRNFNVVAAVDSPDAEDGLNQNVESRDVRAFFPDVVDQLTELLLAPLAWTKWQGADLPPLPYWFRDHLLLVGDAAHPTLPYLAQGAAMALEDACELASCLKGNRNIAGAFANFENQRRPRAVRIQEESRKLGGIYHARGPVSLARNTYMRLAGADKAMRRHAWVYEWKPAECN